MANRGASRIFRSIAVIVVFIGIQCTGYAKEVDETGITPSLERIYSNAGTTKKPVFGVARFEYEYDNIGIGISRLLSAKLTDSSFGRYTVASEQSVNDLLSAAGVDPNSIYSDRATYDLTDLKGIDYLVVGRIRVFDVYQTSPQIGPLSLDFMLPKEAEARVVLEYTLLNAVENRFELEGCVTRERIHQDFIVSNFDTWKATMDLLSPTFIKHPLGLPAIQSLDEIVGNITAGLLPAGKIVERFGATVIAGFDAPVVLNEGEYFYVLVNEDRTDEFGNIVWHSLKKVGIIRVLEVRSNVVLCEIVDGVDKIETGMSVEKAFPDEKR